MNDREKIKILYFHPTIVFGGAERATTKLLHELNKSIFDVILVTKERIFNDLPVKKVVYIDDVGISDGFSGIKRLIYDAKTMKGMIKEEKPDIAFGMLHYGCIVLSLTKFFLGDKIKIIISPRTPSRDAINYYFRRNLDRMLWNFMVQFFCKHSDYIMVPCDGMKNECILSYRADKERISTIRNYIDIALIKKLSMETVQLKNQSDHFVISTSARLASEKNLHVLMRAFASLRTYLNAQLWIIGDGPERPHLESLASELGISREVIFWGFQTNPYKYITRSDVFVHTSVFEGFANVIWEAIACRVPVIATDCNYGPREIIRDMENGILVPVSDEVALMQALKTVSENQDLRRNLVDNAYRRLLDFDAIDIVHQYEDIFLKISQRKSLS